MCRSLPQIPQRPTLTTTCPASGVGSGKVSRARGVCRAWKVTAFISRFFAYRNFAVIDVADGLQLTATELCSEASVHNLDRVLAIFQHRKPVKLIRPAGVQSFGELLGRQIARGVD